MSAGWDEDLLAGRTPTPLEVRLLLSTHWSDLGYISGVLNGTREAAPSGLNPAAYARAEEALERIERTLRLVQAALDKWIEGGYIDSSSLAETTPPTQEAQQ